PEGATATEQFDFTVTDTHGDSFARTLTFNVVGADDAPRITGADPFGTVTEDAGPTTVVNGGFETGDFTGWSDSPGAGVSFLAIGGALGNYAAQLNGGFITQDVATTPGQHYQLTFYVAGDAESSTNSFTAFWDGSAVLAVTDQFGGFTRYTFDVVGDG